MKSRVLFGCFERYFFDDILVAVVEISWTVFDVQRLQFFYEIVMILYLQIGQKQLYLNQTTWIKVLMDFDCDIDETNQKTIKVQVLL